jgi:pimeloyl-ACP methyl ester carboxylesterase
MDTMLAYDDTGGTGPLVVLLPGAGDVRSENRFLVERLAAAGHRVVNADLPGHGSSPAAPAYGVAETAEAIADLVEELDAGPALVIGCSFAPAAAVWMAAERPDLVRGIGLISPHLEAEGGLAAWIQRISILALLRGPLAAPLWSKLYRGWYKTTPPDDLDEEIRRIAAMMRDPARRRAARRTLVADRDGVAERIEHVEVPALVVFGSDDDHFEDPRAEADRIADRLAATVAIVDGAGHYPHVEQPDVVADAVIRFSSTLV